MLCKCYLNLVLRLIFNGELGKKIGIKFEIVPKLRFLKLL